MYNCPYVGALALVLAEHVGGTSDIAVAGVCKKRKCLLVNTVK